MKQMTKKQIKAMRDAVMGTWLTLASMQMPAAVFVQILSEKRRDVVLAGIRERVTWHEEHAANNRASAEHFREHPHVYGTSTPEMIERFEASAVTYDKGAAWFRALLERIEAEELPREIIEFDPTQRAA